MNYNIYCSYCGKFLRVTKLKKGIESINDFQWYTNQLIKEESDKCSCRQQFFDTFFCKYEKEKVCEVIDICNLCCISCNLSCIRRCKYSKKTQSKTFKLNFKGV